MNFFFTNIAYADFDSIVKSIDTLIINPFIVFLFALALAYFLYGVVQFIGNQENEEKKTAGKKHMLWGVVGIAIMMSVWTILSIIMNTLNIQGINPKEGTVQLNDYNPDIPPLNP